MLIKDAVIKRILELCNQYGYTPNKLTELSTVPPPTLHAVLAGKVKNPSVVVIYKICRTFKIELKDFYNSNLFDTEFDD